MSKLLLVAILLFFIALSLYRFFIFNPPPPAHSELPTIYAGLGYLPRDPSLYDLTDLIHSGLSRPVSVSLTSDSQTLLIYQETGEVLGLPRTTEGSFSPQLELLHESASPSPLSSPTNLDPFIRRHPEANSHDLYRPSPGVTDPQTGSIYFTDYFEGRLYVLQPINHSSISP